MTNSAKFYTPKQFGELIGASPRTLQRWAKAGSLIPHRWPSGRPYYTDKHFEALDGVHPQDDGEQPLTPAG